MAQADDLRARVLAVPRRDAARNAASGSVDMMSVYERQRYPILNGGAAFMLLRKGLEPSHPALLGAAAGAMSGAWGAVLVFLWCPQTDALHALVGHVLPNILLIALGAKIGSSTLSLRRMMA